MEDQYYSKKLDQFFPTRVDILLYAHDGRGLGHVHAGLGREPLALEAQAGSTHDHHQATDAGVADDQVGATADEE